MIARRFVAAFGHFRAGASVIRAFLR